MLLPGNCGGAMIGDRWRSDSAIVMTRIGLLRNGEIEVGIRSPGNWQVYIPDFPLSSTYPNLNQEADSEPSIFRHGTLQRQFGSKWRSRQMTIVPTPSSTPFRLSFLLSSLSSHYPSDSSRFRVSAAVPGSMNSRERDYNCGALHCVIIES